MSYQNLAEHERMENRIINLEAKVKQLQDFLKACLADDKFTRIVHLNILARDTKAKLTK